MNQKLTSLNEQLKDLNLKQAFELIQHNFEGQWVFSTSFGQEDQVLTHHILQEKIPVQMFTIDTGRLFSETYEVHARTLSKYHFKIKTFFPKNTSVESIVNNKGPLSFYNSVEDRKECCYIRKIEPLKRALSKADVWVTGLRAKQSLHRSKMSFLQWDTQFEVLKFNPLLLWKTSEIETYLDQHEVPQNSLHKKGYPSIGCAPCTRAISPDEDPRAGRWWWENSHKECGLHATQKNL